MTDIAHMRGGTVARAEARPDPRKAAQAALEGEDALLSPLRAYREASDGWREAMNPPSGMPAGERQNWARQHMVAEAALVAIDRDLRCAAAAGADDRKNRVLVALMVDSFRNSKPDDLGVATETLLHDLRAAGHPPIVVAQALQSLRRTERFLPGIAEILTACTKAREHLALCCGLVARMADDRARLLASAMNVPDPARRAG